MLEFLGWLIAWPIYLMGKVSSNFAVCVLLYVVLFRIIYIIIDYISLHSRYKSMICKRYVGASQRELLPNNKQANDDFCLYVYNKLKMSPITGFILAVLVYIIFILFYKVVTNPFTYFYGFSSETIETIKNAVIEHASIDSKSITDFSAILYIKDNFINFKDVFGCKEIFNTNIEILGLNLLKPAKFNDFSVVIPLLLIGLTFVGTIKSIVNMVKNKTFFKTGNLLSTGLMLFITLSLAASSFMLPIVVFVYYIVFRIFSYLIEFIFAKTVKKSLLDKYKIIVDEIEVKYKEYFKEQEQISIGEGEMKYEYEKQEN